MLANMAAETSWSESDDHTTLLIEQLRNERSRCQSLESQLKLAQVKLHFNLKLYKY